MEEIENKDFIKCQNFLLEKGFYVEGATYIGYGKYEFKEHWCAYDKLGIHTIHKITAWVDDGEVEYFTKVIGMCAND